MSATITVNDQATAPLEKVVAAFDASFPGTWIIEHKTSGADIGLGSVYWKKLTLDAQISDYMVGARALGFEPRGVLYDVIGKPKIRPLMATPEADRKYTKPTKAEPEPRLYANQRLADETPQEYGDRLRADICANPEKYFQRGKVVRLESEEKEAAFDTWSHARMIREAQIANRWPRNVDACETFNSMCDFWPVCSGEADINDPIKYRDAEKHEELAADADDGKVRLPIVTPSSLRSFRSCHRRYYFAYELRRRSHEATKAMRFGTLMHKGLEVWWTTVDLNKAIAAMAGETDPFEYVKAVELMRGYHARWIGESWDVVAVEQQYSAPLINPETNGESRTFRRSGKIDAIAREVVVAQVAQ